MTQKSINQNNSYEIQAEVHKPVGSGFRVKASILDFGIYINGMMVFAPNEENKQWCIYTPAKPAGRGKYVHVIEFDKTTTLWSEITKACIGSVEQYLGHDHFINTPWDKKQTTVGSTEDEKNNQDQVYDVVDDQPIDLNDIQF